jgi:hypothetical protein
MPAPPPSPSSLMTRSHILHSSPGLKPPLSSAAPLSTSAPRPPLPLPSYIHSPTPSPTHLLQICRHLVRPPGEGQRELLKQREAPPDGDEPHATESRDPDSSVLLQKS